MTRISKRNLQPVALLIAGAAILLVAGCGRTGNINIDYPAEQVDFQIQGGRVPGLYIERVVDLRPLAQKRGGGYFFEIRYPKDKDWARDPAELYAEALARDLEQTHLVEMVPLRAQADYVLEADVLQLGCRFQRSLNSFLVPGILGAGVGAFFGDDFSGRAKRGAVGAVLGIVAIPMPSKNHAVAEIRLTLRDNTGNQLWQERCLGEVDERLSATATSRSDQKWLNRTLPRAIKKANGCLVGQLRRKMIELGESEPR